MSQNPTFGCGVFLPGEGPGNFPEFTGGGTIDGGGGFGGDDPDPPTPIDPDPSDPDKVCACIPDTTDPAENVIYPPDGFGIAIVTRVYDQTCTEFPNQDLANLEIESAKQIIINQDPPPVLDGWVLIDGPIIAGEIGKDCQLPNGQCSLFCPPITVTTRWRRGRTTPAPPITGPPPAGPTTTGDTDTTGIPGGAAPPPQGPTTTPPGTAPPPGRVPFPCGCVVVNINPEISNGVTLNNGCVLRRATWEYSCEVLDPDDPVVGPKIGQNPEQSFQPTPRPGYTIAEITDRGRYSGTCRPNNCGGSCGDGFVIWRECPPPPGNFGGAGEVPDDGPGGNGITPGPDLGLGAGAPPFQTPGGPGGNGITPGPDAGGKTGISTKGDLPTTPPPVPIPGDASPSPAGEGLISESSLDGNLVNNALATQDIDLNNPAVIREILKLKPNGIEDNVIAFNKSPQVPTLVQNDTEFTELFNENIDSNIYYILKNKNNSKNWDSTKAAGVTAVTVLSSLKPEIRSIINKIKNYDGTNLTQNQIFNMIGSRILDGSIGNITKRFLQTLADDSQKRVPTTITRSSINKVNEVAALILIDRNKIPLDTSKLIGRERQIFKNFKILSSDVDKFLPIKINGADRRFYINDDDTFIDRTTLSIEDGDFFEISSGDKVTRLFTQSEVDHAFLIPEDVRQRAIALLGGESGRILSVSGDAATASGIEFDSSLSSSRQPFYVLSAVLSSVQTSPSFGGSFLLKNTTLRYQLMDTSSAEGLRATNQFIKFKANKRIFVLDHEDLIIDYIENTESVNLTQTDILFNSPKVNKNIPLLVRQVPFYIMVYPTNRPEYNIFNDKSKILEIANDGAVTRELRCKTHINPEFTQPQTNKFIRYGTVGRDASDILGNTDSQTRISFIDPTDSIFKTGFRKNNELVSASEYGINRSKTGFRLLREIINELDTNYELSFNGIGKTLTEFDAFSRLNLKQFNILSRLENFNEINRAISNGLINEVKLIPPIENADNRIVINKTQLVQRKTTAGADTFQPIKATNDGLNIISPNEDGVGGFGPAS